MADEKTIKELRTLIANVGITSFRPEPFASDKPSDPPLFTYLHATYSDGQTGNAADDIDIDLAKLLEVLWPALPALLDLAERAQTARNDALREAADEVKGCIVHIADPTDEDNAFNDGIDSAYESVLALIPEPSNG